MLLVDDLEDARAMLALALEDLRLEVAEARDGASALELLRRGLRPSLIVLDIVMPGLDGRDVLAALPALGKDVAAIPVLVMTGQPNVTLPASVPMLLKPFDLRTFADEVKRLLGLRRRKRAR